MSDALSDTDVLVRLIAANDPQKHEQAVTLFERVEQGSLSLDAPATVIADTVFVLTSKRLYNLPCADVAAQLSTLVHLPGFHVRDRRVVLHALQLFSAMPNLDIGDAMLVAQAEASGVTTLYSYGRYFDRVPAVFRQEQ